MKTKATEDSLGMLHQLVACQLIEALNDKTLELDERIKVINQAIKFLKDNSIECDIAANGGSELMDQLLAAAAERDDLTNQLTPETYHYDPSAH